MRSRRRARRRPPRARTTASDRLGVLRLGVAPLLIERRDDPVVQLRRRLAIVCRPREPLDAFGESPPCRPGNRRTRAGDGGPRGPRARRACRAGARAAARAPRHTSRCSSAIASRRRRSAVRILVFAVPIGMPSISATSALVLPPKYASSSAARCSPESRSIALRARAAMSAVAASSSGCGRLIRLERFPERLQGTRLEHAPSERVDRQRACDQQHPRLQLPPRLVVAIRAPPELHERVLHQILRGRVAPEHHDAEPVDAGGEAAVEHVGSGRVATRERAASAPRPTRALSLACAARYS